MVNGPTSEEIEKAERRFKALTCFTHAIDMVRNKDAMFPIQQLHVLMVIALNPDISGRKLMELTGLSRNAVSQNTRNLGETHYSGKREGLGLVSTREDPADRRGQLHRLTPDGVRFVKSIAGALEPELI